jgi:hypothetical protein
LSGDQEDEEGEEEQDGSDRAGCLFDTAEGAGCCAIEAMGAFGLFAGLLALPAWLLLK